MTKINFSKYFKITNYLSLFLFTLSIILIIFKGLNYGIDFKGGTLLEIKMINKNISISDIRSSLNNLNLGDVNVKEFGDKGNYLIKVEKKLNNNEKLIPELKKALNKKLNDEVNYRRVESVGPKISSELLKSGLISICLALFVSPNSIWESI